MHAKKTMRFLGLLMAVSMLLSLAAPALAAPPSPEQDTKEFGSVALDGKGAARPHEQPLIKDLKLARLYGDIPNPRAYKRLMEAERQALAAGVSPKTLGYGTQAAEQILYVLVEFTGTQTFDILDEETCEPTGETITIEGPLHNMIPHPGPRDNNTFWAEDFSAELYQSLLFDDASGGIGVVRTDLNNGAGVDLTGKTFRAYYNEVSEGAYDPGGMVVGWIQVPVSEGEYGADGCIPGVGFTTDNRNGPFWRFAADALDALNAMYPDFDWTVWDPDGDGFVNNIQFIHAGMGQEAGGGAQGDFSIWSKSTWVNWPDGYLVDPVNNIRVNHIGVNPENIDVGVAAEEFGHTVFGLPDLYSYDYTYSNSIGFWTIMSGGSWNGELGGMEPAPFPLWFRWLVGWANESNMAIFDINSEEATVTLGQREKTPEGTLEGLMFRLPDIVEIIENPMDTGQAWWGARGDLMENTLIQGFDLTGATAPVVFSFDSWWDIEVDWDYGFFKVSTDGGATWDVLPDTTGFLTDANPNAQNQGWGLTGAGEGRLEFDLSAYAGQNVLVRLEYWTDMAVNELGWFVDNFSLDDATGNLFTDNVESPPGGWTVDGWLLVPYEKTSPNYYMAEWVNYSGFDHGLHYAYQTVYTDDDEWEVDRVNYNAPGLLVYYRDTRWDTTMPGDFFAPPSIGYKQGLLVVDSHPWPWRWESDGANLGGRVQSADATFTLHDKAAVDVRRGNWTTGEIIETNTFGPIPADPTFNDWYGYYPGFWYPDEGGPYVYWVDTDASTVIPAEDIYSVRISHWDGAPFQELYGARVAGYPLADGNPGDWWYNPGGRVNWGVHFDVEEVAPDGSWAKVHVYRYALDYTFTSDKDMVEATPMNPEPQTFTFTATKTGTGTSPEPAQFVFDLPETLDYVSVEANYGDYSWHPGTRQVRWSGWVGQPLEVTINTMATGASTVWASVDDGAGVTDLLGWATGARVNVQQGFAGYKSTKDAYIDLWDPNGNHGGEYWVRVRQTNIQKALVRFDDLMDRIPAGAQVTSAMLSLTSHAPTNAQWQEVKVAPVLTDWVEGQVTWNQAALGMPWTTPGGDYGDAVDAVVVDTPDERYTWDVTEIVQDWVDGVHPNYGFALFSDTQKGSVQYRFWGHDWPSPPADPNAYPALVIEYYLP
ncbi:MAG: M6 family metalloprotease domain-containing protein [Anaerolineae bacterium]